MAFLQKKGGILPDSVLCRGKSAPRPGPGAETGLDIDKPAQNRYIYSIQMR